MEAGLGQAPVLMRMMLDVNMPIWLVDPLFWELADLLVTNHHPSVCQKWHGEANFHGQEITTIPTPNNFYVSPLHPAKSKLAPDFACWDSIDHEVWGLG